MNIARWRGNWGLVFIVFKYVIPLTFAWLALGWRRFQRQHKLDASQGWSSVEGVILGGKVAPVPKTRLYRATLSYSYFVQEYRADEYAREFSKEADADEFVRSLKDRRLQIRYKPGNPDISVLDESALAQLVSIPLRR